MANFVQRTVVGINEHTKNITFYTMQGTDYHTINVSSVTYKSQFGSEKFEEDLGETIKNYVQKRPANATMVMNFVLPDFCVATDNISIPAIKKRAVDNSFKVAMEGLYKNHEKLKINSTMVQRNKQYITFSLAMLNKDIYDMLSKICVAQKLTMGIVTYAGNSDVVAVSVLRKKMANESYIFMDVKPRYTRMSYVVKGKVFGAIDLNFGYSILRNNRVTAEDMAINHDIAELAVINAREKARAKQLTVMDDGSREYGEKADDDITEEEMEREQQDRLSIDMGEEGSQKLFTRKTARKLPKFMLRPTPETELEYVSENFRLFTKWALSFIRGNETLAALGKPETVLVNIPSDYNDIFEIINAEKDENGVTFTAFDPDSDRFSSVTENLELFGGLFLDKYPSLNNL